KWFRAAVQLYVRQYGPPSCPTNTMKDPNVLSVVSWI
ncbi:unnamed protein product, partial [Allacma fusca]